MVDPTALNESLDKKGKKQDNYYGKTFLTGLLGGFLGGVILLSLRAAFQITCFPLFALSGVGVYVMYLYFTEECDRRKNHKYFLLLSAVASVIVVMFCFLLIYLFQTGAGITGRNILDTYFHNAQEVESVVDGTLFMHFIALIFELAGLGLCGLYLKIATQKWEKKHGKDEKGYGYRSKIKKGKKRK